IPHGQCRAPDRRLAREVRGYSGFHVLSEAAEHIARIPRVARLFRGNFTRECGLDRARDDDSSLCCSRNASAERPNKSESCRSCAGRGLVLRQIMPMVREGSLKRATDSDSERVSTATAISGINVTPMPALTI